MGDPSGPAKKMTIMTSSKITRIWHGVTLAEQSEAYLEYVVKTGIAEYRSIDGNLSAKILRRMDVDKCHFWTVTEWDSYESIKKFAGEDYERAKYYPEDADFLLEFEPNVLHCETFEF
jgi:heme-degrading monooxygenase HmoA